MRYKPNFFSSTKCVLLFLSLICGNGFAQVDPFKSVFGPRIVEIKAAAEAGDAAAQFQLGQEYGSHWSNAVVWFRKSARQGNADGQHALGSFLLEGMPGVKANTAEGLEWLRLSANQGNANAQVQLAGIYEKGKHVNRDYAESLKWYTLAERKGSLIGRVYGDALVLKMTAEQVAEGKKRAGAFVATKPSSSVPPLKLQGIAGSGKKAIAIINGKNLMVGDQETIKVDDELLKVKCLSITNGVVTLSVAGETELRVFHIK